MTRSSIKMLIDLAHSRTDSAASRLGQIATQERELEQRLALLLDYRNQYRERFLESLQRGADRAGVDNHHAFMAALERAIAQSREQLDQLHQRRSASQEQWRHQRRGLKSFQTLDQRLQAGERAQAARAEQRSLDERAARPGGAGLLRETEE